MLVSTLQVRTHLIYSRLHVQVHQVSGAQHDASLHFMQCNHAHDADTLPVQAMHMHVCQKQQRIQHQTLSCVHL